MSIEVHMLGTSSARPTSVRQVSGSVVSCRDGLIVVDAGEGFQTRFAEQRKRMKNYEKYHLKSSKVSVLCLTHGHLDHTWGVLPWLQSMALDSRQQPLLIIGPTTGAVLDALLDNQPLPTEISKSDLAIQFRFWHQLGGKTSSLGYPVRWVLGDVQQNRWVEFVDDGTVIALPNIPQPDGWHHNSIEALPTLHTTPSCAYRITAGVERGKFDRERANQLGLDDSQRAALAAGKDIDYNGVKLLSKDFRGMATKALSVVISGDTSEMATGITSLSDCDLLVHEATFLDDYSNHADDYLHSTASGAARTALACGAKHLVLTHYGARIKQPDGLLEEAMSAVRDTEIVITAACDGDRILVDSSGKIIHMYWRGSGWND